MNLSMLSLRGEGYLLKGLSPGLIWNFDCTQQELNTVAIFNDQSLE